MPKKLKLKPWQPKEYDEQVVVFEWARLKASQHQVLKFLHANLNGLRLPIGLAVKAKRAGMVQGVPDIFLPVPMPRGDFRYIQCGLYIELKRRDGGHLSEGQEWWLSHLRALGYRVEVTNGAQAAIQVICDYLGIIP